MCRAARGVGSCGLGSSRIVRGRRQSDWQGFGGDVDEASRVDDRCGSTLTGLCDAPDVGGRRPGLSGLSVSAVSTECCDAPDVRQSRVGFSGGAEGLLDAVESRLATSATDGRG